MTDQVVKQLTRLQKVLSDQAQLASTAHGQFLQLRQVSMEEMEIDERDALEEEIFTFLNAIKGAGAPAVDGVEGRRALTVALEISSQIERRMREGGQVSGGGSSEFF